MRQVQFQEAEEHFADLISEAEAGASLTILRGGKPVAQIIPFPEPLTADPDREASASRLLAFMRKGIDMGGFKITDRDAIYDRD